MTIGLIIPYQLNEQKKRSARIQYIRDDANIDAHASGNTIKMKYKT